MKAIIVFFFVLFSFGSLEAYAQFIENKGQVLDVAENFHPEVKYLYGSGNNAMYFENYRVVCVFAKKDNFDYAPYEGNQKAKDSIYRTLGMEMQRIDIEFVGASDKVELISSEKEGQYINYFLNKRENIRNVGVFKNVCYKNIYPNIDIVFYQYKTGLKYDIILHPGARIEDVKIRYRGASSLELINNTVKIKTKFYEFTENIPIAFINDDKKQQAEVQYFVNDDMISFSCKYSVSDKLTIDPVVEWMTYFETATSDGYMDYDHNVADANGNLFISGYCNNSANNYPTVNPGGSAYIQVWSSNDLYIAKFNTNRALVWSTYFGGSNSSMDWGLGTEVMATGGDVLHIVGDELATNSPFLNGGGFYYNAGAARPYYLRFNKNTGQLLHCTNISGGYHPSIAVSPSGQVAILLHAYDFNTVHVVNRAGAYNQAVNGGFTDLFLMLLNSSYAQIWGTFLGGPGTQENGHVAFDASNNIFFTGEVSWSGTSTAANEHLVNPGGSAYYQTAVSGEDIMIGKFTSTGALYWNTLYGGNGNDGLDDEMGNGTNVLISPTNELVVIGGTSSTNFPLLALGGAYNMPCPANVNAGGSYDDFASFILKFSNTGVRQWATYWGENSATSWALLYDAKYTDCDKFIVAARALYTTMPLAGQYNKATGGQSFLMQFNNNYAAEWSSYVGNSTSEPQICFSDFDDRLYLTTSSYSLTESTVNPGGGAYYDGSPADYGYTIWQFKIVSPPVFNPLGPYCVGAAPAALPTTSINGITGTWSPSAISTASAGTTTYTFTPTAGQCGAIAATMTITVNANVTPTFTAMGPYCIGASPGTLQGTSNNGISGTWSPATISTASAGTATYTFTPAAGPCATTATMVITVNAKVTPTFTALGPYCMGASPGTLSTTSNNGITGTWSPATISTAAAGTSIYSFTPTAGLCANTTTMSVTINPTITPSVSIASVPIGAGCPEANITFTASPINGGTSPAYQWQNNGVNIIGATGSTYSSSSLPSGSQITCILTSNAICASGSVTSAPIIIIYNAPPVAIITGNSLVCIGTTSVLSAATSIPGNGSITGYQWWYNNGVTNTAIPGATGVTYAASAPGIYTVVITDSNGCTSVLCP